MTVERRREEVLHWHCPCEPTPEGPPLFTVLVIVPDQGPICCSGIGGEENKHAVRGVIFSCARCGDCWCFNCIVLSNLAHVRGAETTQPPSIARAIATLDARLMNTTKGPPS